MTPTDIVATKAFGDLVIVLTSLSAGSAWQGRLLLGEHLVPLANALGAMLPVTIIPHGEAGVPAMYDVRRCGIRAAMDSARRLRLEIRRAGSEALLFDRIGMRERWLAGGVPAHALPEAGNIYLAYADILATPTVRPSVRVTSNAHIGIFPGSRLPAKNLPEMVVRQAIDSIERAGLIPQLFLLEGERPDLEASGLDYRIVPRSFVEMKEAVAQCGAIVSADSMPAHIAEHCGVPVFVLSPVDNRYWLPLSAYSASRWAKFSDDVAACFGRFLTESTEIDA